MTDDNNEYRISRWLAEFADPEMERSFQSNIQTTINRQLRIVLIVWGALLMLFAVPDYVAIGATRPFYYLLAYRVAITVALLIAFFTITPKSDFFEISSLIALIVMAGFSGFMMFFYFRPDDTYWIVGIIMLQLLVLLMFVPIRFILSFSVAMYGVVVTLLTRFAMGSPKPILIVLFILLMLPVITGAATTMRLGVLQRRQFALLSKTEKINLELQKALSEIKQLSGLLPICSSCKKIRNDNGYWEQIEGYIRDHSKAEFSHGICPDCAKKFYPDFHKDK